MLGARELPAKQSQPGGGAVGRPARVAPGREKRIAAAAPKLRRSVTLDFVKWEPTGDGHRGCCTTSQCEPARASARTNDVPVASEEKCSVKP